MKLNSFGVVLFVVNLLVLIASLRNGDEVATVISAIGIGVLSPFIISRLLDMSK